MVTRADVIVAAQTIYPLKPKKKYLIWEENKERELHPSQKSYAS